MKEADAKKKGGKRGHGDVDEDEIARVSRSRRIMRCTRLCHYSRHSESEKYDGRSQPKACVLFIGDGWEAAKGERGQGQGQAEKAVNTSIVIQKKYN